MAGDTCDAVFSGADAGLAQIDVPTGRIIRVNRAFCQLVGYREDELLHSLYQDFMGLAGGEQGAERVSLRADLQKKEPIQFIRKDAQVVWLEPVVTLSANSASIIVFFKNVHEGESREARWR